MKYIPHDDVLRAQLEFGASPMPADKHAAAIKKLRETHPHQIEPTDDQPPMDQENCLAAALEIPIERKGQFANARFARWLLQPTKLTELSSLKDGCLIFYFISEIRGLRWTHAGIADGADHGISKWGEFWQFHHPLDQVPHSYGDYYRAFERPDQAAASAFFGQYIDDCNTKLPKWARVEYI